jgi:WD40 repeat protein
MLRTILAGCCLAAVIAAGAAAPVPARKPAARLVHQLSHLNKAVVPNPVLSPDGRWLAAGHVSKVNNDLRGVIALTDLSQAPPKTIELLGHTGGLVRDVGFSHDSRKLVSTGTERGGNADTIRLWDVATRKELRVTPAPDGLELDRVCFMADNERLAVGYGNGEVEVISFRDDKVERAKVHKHGGGVVLMLRASPCGRWLLSGSHHGVIVADAKTLKEVHRWDAPKWGLISGVSPDGTRFVTRPLRSAEYTVWETATGKKVCECVVPGFGAEHLPGWAGVSFSPDNRFLATAAAVRGGTDGKEVTGRVHVWDAATGKLIFEFQADPFMTEAALFGKSSDTLVTLGYDSRENYGFDGPFKLWALDGLPPKDNAGKP